MGSLEFDEGSKMVCVQVVSPPRWVWLVDPGGPDIHGMGRFKWDPHARARGGTGVGQRGYFRLFGAVENIFWLQFIRNC